MRTNLGIAGCCILCCCCIPASPGVVIPNGGAGVGSLSVIDPTTGMIERNLVTAVAPAQPSSRITNYNFAITDAGGSVAVIGLQQSPAAYILSAVDLSTGAITGHVELSYVPKAGVPVVVANPGANVLYLGYDDTSGDFHIQALDPITLHVIQQSNLGAYGGQAMIVSPDGQTIYVTDSSAVIAVEASNLGLIGTVPLAVVSNATVSPDSSTLYVAAGEYPNVTVAVIDTATLQVSESIPISEVSAVFGIAISPSGSQLYLSGQANSQGTDIFTLDLATRALTSVSVVVNGSIAVSPAGTVYAGVGTEVLVFDPASQSVTSTISADSTGVFALNSTGSRIYYLNSRSSALAATAPPPSPAILGETATGQLESTAYDATNNLVLAADTANNIEVLNAATFQPTGHLFEPNLNTTPPYLSASGGSGFVTMAGEVARFDPVSLVSTGTVALPSSANYLVSYSPTVMDGSTLLVPFSFSFNGGPIQFGRTGSQSVPPNGVWVIDTLQMKIVATWPFPALPLLGLAAGSSVAYAVFPAGGQQLDVEEIELSTGRIVAGVQVPGVAGYYSNPAVSPDGSIIYLFSGNTLYTFSASTLVIINSAAGVGLTNLSVSPDGSYLYGGTPVPCQDCSEQIISTSSLEVLGTIPTSTAYPEPVLFVAN